jgi:hypothetical protein
MHKKFLLTNILLSLALSLAVTGARADSETGASNITIGSTGVSGPAGLLYSDGSHAQSLPGTYAAGSGYIGNTFTLSNGTYFEFQSDGSKSTAPLTVSITSSAYNYNNQAEFYGTNGGVKTLLTYINQGGIYTGLAMIASGHYSGPAGLGRQILLPTVYVPSMFASWADITGPGYLARDNQGIAGEYSFIGMTAAGAMTIALDARDTQLVFGNQTCASSCLFAGNAFFGSVGAANLRFGGADAASPVAQTISFQSAAGVSNTAGVNTTFQASAGTGTGVGGSFLFQTAAAGSSGTGQNGFATALAIAPTLVTLGPVTSTANAPQLVLAPASGNGFGISSYYWGGGNLVFQGNNSGVTGSWSYVAAINGYGFEAPSTAGFCVSSSTNPTGGVDTCLWRASAGVATLGNGTQGDFSGVLKLANVIATGSPSTASAGQISYGGATAASSNCGSLSGAAGCIVENIAGTTHYTPYY